MMADNAHIHARVLLEVCVDTAGGLAAAVQNGADRIELCSALSEGGLTPSFGLMKLAAACDVPVRAMIRPRAGDFTYSDDELAIMAADIDAAASCGLDGVVLCVNRPSGELDEAALKALCEHARSLSLAIALNRGLDLAPDPLTAMETAVALGVDTLLTSGGAQTASQGAAGLAALVKAARGRIEILAGGGVNSGNVAQLAAAGVTAFHASCSAPLPVTNTRAAALGYVTASQRDTDPASIAQLRQTLNRLSIESAPEKHHVVR